MGTRGLKQNSEVKVDEGHIAGTKEGTKGQCDKNYLSQDSMLWVYIS